MGAEDDDGALGHLVGLLDEDRAAALEGGDDVLVVDDLLADVDRGAVDLQGPLDGDHRPVHAGAVPPGVGQEDTSALISHAPIVGGTGAPPLQAPRASGPDVTATRAGVSGRAACRPATFVGQAVRHGS